MKDDDDDDDYVKNVPLSNNGRPLKLYNEQKM